MSYISADATTPSIPIDPLEPHADFTVVVDGLIFGKQRYGGLINYWTHLLGLYWHWRVPVELSLPPTLRAAPTDVWPPGSNDHGRVFHSTYYTLPTVPVDATVLTVHDCIYEDFPDAAAAFDPTGETLDLKRACVAAADAIIVPSRATADRLAYHYPTSTAPVKVIHHGIDDLFVYPVPPPTADATAGFRLAAGSTRAYILHVGGRESYKNFRVVLEAYRSSRLPDDFDLVVVGSQSEALPDELEALAAMPANACVVFLCEVSMPVLSGLYRGAAAVVSASLVEGFGLPAVEAAIGGTPVAVSRIAAYEETLGSAAVFFDPTDPDDCARAIHEAIEWGAHERIRSSRTMQNTYVWYLTLKRTLEVYRSALSGGTR